MEKVIHVTLVLNEDSIRRRGLLRSFSKGIQKVVWVVRPGRKDWALRHVLKKYSATPEEVMVIEFAVGVSDVKFRKDGLGIISRDVKPGELTRFRKFILR